MTPTLRVRLFLSRLKAVRRRMQKLAPACPVRIRDWSSLTERSTALWGPLNLLVGLDVLPTMSAFSQPKKFSPQSH